MVYFLHKLTFSSSETFLKSIAEISSSTTFPESKMAVMSLQFSQHATDERFISITFT